MKQAKNEQLIASFQEAASESEYDNTSLAEYTALVGKKYIKNQKILFIQTLQFQLDTFNLQVARNRGYYVYPPTGLQTLVKALQGRGLEFEILDLNLELLKRVQGDEDFDHLDWLSIVDEKIAEFQPSVVGVTCIGVATNLFNPTHPLTSVLRYLKEKHKVLVLAGGPIATDEAYTYLKHDICHFVVKGEAENKINFLFDHLFHNDDVPAMNLQHPLQDISFKHNGVVSNSAGYKDIVRVQGNLVDSYKLVPIESYHQYGSLNPFSRMVGVDTPFSGFQLNRGCRANCKFCGVPKFMGKGVRQVPNQLLLDEISYLVEQRGIRHFELLDDDFFGTSTLRDGVYTVLGHLKNLRSKYDNISWSAGNGLIAAAMNEELMQLISDSGCVGYRIGIESGNTDMLRRLRKPASLKSLRKFVQLSKPYPNIFTSGNYIIGLFGEENFGEMLDTYRLSCELDMDWASYSTYQFTSKTTSEVENLQDDDEGASECIPSKDASSHEIRVSDSLMVGVDIFNINAETVPSREQVKEIWFVFNFLSNYINNRNLAPGGNPEKLVSWLNAVQLSYPENPYMPLFAAYAYVLMREHEKAQDALTKARINIRASVYWQERFEQFGLFELLEQLPSTTQEVYIRLDAVKARFLLVEDQVERKLCLSH